MKKFLIISVAIIIIVVAGIAAWPRFFGEKPVYCTQEAKICPDGSYVARTGPNCEFVPCLQTETVKLFYYNPEKV